MEKSTFLGLDLGTSGLRGLLVAADGAAIAAHEVHYTAHHPHKGWSEQDPADWTNACDAVFAALRDAAPDAWRALSGIGVSGHMHGAVLLDADDTVLRPCMLWNDTRSFDEAATLDAIADVRALSGNIVFPGFTAPKVMWVAKNEPQVFAKVAKVVLPAAYLNLWLTGDHVTDMSDAAGTSWLDVGGRDWSYSVETVRYRLIT